MVDAVRTRIPALRRAAVAVLLVALAAIAGTTGVPAAASVKPEATAARPESKAAKSEPKPAKPGKATKPDTKTAKPDAKGEKLASKSAKELPVVLPMPRPEIVPEREPSILPAVRPEPVALPLGEAPRGKPMSSIETTYREALALASQGKWQELERQRRAPRHGALEAVLEWMRLKDASSDATFRDVAAFLSAYPDWPNRGALIARAERLMPEDLPAAERALWFDGAAPRTPEGQFKYLRALEQIGRQDRLVEAVRDTWRKQPMSAADQRIFLDRYRRLLTEDDHWTRADRFLWQGQFGAARQMFPLIGRDRQHLALARIQLRTQGAGVDGAIKRVPEDLQSDPGLVYERLRWRHRKGLKESALDLLWSVPQDQEFAELWWRERAQQIRFALDERRVEDAYLLASGHVQTDGVGYAEAEWHAGWIALRYAGKPREALDAFGGLHANVNSAISQARAAYWAGRAAEELGQHSAAKGWYAKAAAHPTAFYGQLAQGRLGSGSFLLPGRLIAAGERHAAFVRAPAVTAALALANLGRDDLARVFVDHLSREAESGEDAALVGELASRLGYVDLAVRTARRAARYGHALVETGFPVLYDRDDPRIETALVLSVIRQESGFNPEALSSAGARGLMQLMPATAKHVAGLEKEPFSLPRLTQDPAFNLTLGRRYLADLIDRYDGNYVLAVAAYNAGPGNVERWLRERGDPRTGQIDVIDWIERIPFGETRNYVQRVLEGLTVYRARLDRQSPVISWQPLSPRDIWCVATCGVLLDGQQAAAPRER